MTTTMDDFVKGPLLPRIDFTASGSKFRDDYNRHGEYRVKMDQDPDTEQLQNSLHRCATGLRQYLDQQYPNGNYLITSLGWDYPNSMKEVTLRGEYVVLGEDGKATPTRPPRVTLCVG